MNHKDTTPGVIHQSEDFHDHWQVVCAGDGCLATLSLDCADVSEARIMLLLEGWDRRDGLWSCSECQHDGSETETLIHKQVAAELERDKLDGTMETLVRKQVTELKQDKQRDLYHAAPVKGSRGQWQVVDKYGTTIHSGFTSAESATKQAGLSNMAAIDAARIRAHGEMNRQGFPKAQPGKRELTTLTITDAGGFMFKRRDGTQGSAVFTLFLIRAAWDKGANFEGFADGFGAGKGTKDDWSAIRDSTEPAIAGMLLKAINFLGLSS